MCMRGQHMGRPGGQETPQIGQKWAQICYSSSRWLSGSPIQVQSAGGKHMHRRLTQAEPLTSPSWSNRRDGFCTEDITRRQIVLSTAIRITVEDSQVAWRDFARCGFHAGKGACSQRS